ncbi:MAG: hypothetical protein ACE5FQ_16010 [Thiogranum sp.]
MPDNSPQILQLATNPGLSIALRSGLIPDFSQWGQRNMGTDPWLLVAMDGDLVYPAHNILYTWPNPLDTGLMCLLVHGWT